MTTALAPTESTEIDADTWVSKTKASVQYKKFQRTYICGHHQSGNGEGCKGAVRNNRLGPLLCNAYTGPVRCLDCGSTENVDQAEWTCLDAQECRGTIAAKQAKSSIHQQLLSIQAAQIANGNRVDAEANRVRAAVREAIANGGTVLGADGEPIEQGSWLLEDSFLAPMEKKATKQKTGQCRCCGEPTAGGKFRPGHDAKLKSQLHKAIASGTDEEREKAEARLAEEGWA